MARSDYSRAYRHYRIARRTDRDAAIREREAGCQPVANLPRYNVAEPPQEYATDTFLARPAA
jgi:hypothetical protein